MNTSEKIEWVHWALQEAIDGNTAMLEQALELVEDIREQLAISWNIGILQQDTLKVVTEWFDGDENEWRKLEQALGLPLTPLPWEGDDE